jgi:ribonuclease HI
MQIFTDGSKTEYGVGVGIPIFIQNKLAHQLSYTLHNRCSNNQAEQLAIVKAVEKIGKLHINYNIPRIATVHTDGRITLQSLKNTKKSQIPDTKNKEDRNRTRETQLDNHFHLDKSPRRKLRERAGRQASKGSS